MKIIKALLILLIMISCKSHEPFKSKEALTKAKTTINRSYNITKGNAKKLDNKSIYEISNNIDDSIKKSLIIRRLDSFESGNYSNKRLQLVLKLDRKLNELGWKIEFNKDPNLKYKKFNSIEEIEQYLIKIDSVLFKQKIRLNSKTKVDSVPANNKKH